MQSAYNLIYSKTWFLFCVYEENHTEDRLEALESGHPRATTQNTGLGFHQPYEDLGFLGCEG